MIRFTTIICIAAAAAATATPASAQPADMIGHATLEMAPTQLDFAGTKQAAMMYMPSNAVLDSKRPAHITREPRYRAMPRYATIELGSGDKTRFTIAVDEPADSVPHIWLDLNANGDLTDDRTGTWDKVTTTDDKAPNCQGTWLFDVSWADGEAAKYGVNFYRSTDRDTVNYYRAAARTGKINIGPREYEVTLIENDTDARFDKLFDPDAIAVVGENLPKPVWLMLDGDRFDIRGTFQFSGMNYLARISDDGRTLSMEPTFRVISIPRPAERPAMLAAGGQVPEFQALAWTTNGESTKTFNISDYRGKIVVLDMWATWCGPCVAGIPHMNKLQQETADQGVVILALNVYDNKAAYERFVKVGKGKNLVVQFARDPAGRESDASIPKRLFNVTSIPATYVIDRNGKIVAAVSGYSSGDTRVDDALKSLGIKLKQ